MMKTSEEEDVIIFKNIWEINYYKYENNWVFMHFSMCKFTTLPKLYLHQVKITILAKISKSTYS